MFAFYYLCRKLQGARVSTAIQIAAAWAVAIYQLTARFRLQFYLRCRPRFINSVLVGGYLLNFSIDRNVTLTVRCCGSI